SRARVGCSTWASRRVSSTSPAPGSTTASSASGRAARRRSNTCARTQPWRTRSRRRCASGPARRRLPQARMAKRVRPAATPVGDAYEAAVRYLGGRPHTVAEIHRHLRSKKFDAETIEHAVDRLRAQRYVDDEAFARWWVEQRERFKPRGD